MNTVKSHGWYVLAPWRWSEDTRTLSRALQTEGRVRTITIREAAPGVIAVSGAEDYAQLVRDLVVRVLRIADDLSGFWALCERMGEHNSVRLRHGRLLRSPTVFEDVIKVMLTVNTTWPRTMVMCERLVECLGAGTGDKAFPEPEVIVAAGCKTLREDVKLGFRSEWIVELAARVRTGDLDLEELLSCDDPDTARRILLSIRGVGPYGAAVIMALVGHYTDLPVDSEFVRRVAPAGLSSAEVKKLYEQWGNWRYLAYWFNLCMTDETTIPTTCV